ncbi:hypothetical protein N9595_04550 [Bacteroidia bacterium]|nr:hypothetical protein [Bacteroidia bacterium]
MSYSSSFSNTGFSQSSKFNTYYDQFIETKDNNDSLTKLYLNLAHQELKDTYTKGLKPGDVFYYKAYQYYNQGNYEDCLANFLEA